MENMFQFSEPTQVKFLDINEEEVTWLGGIAYRDEIICGCCGAIINLDEFWAEWKQLKECYPDIESPLVVYANWESIEEYIRD
jgi:hypothetical protein